MIVENTYYHKGNFYQFVAEVDYSEDDNYGADADGNRGTKIYLINEIEVQVFDRDDNEVFDETLSDLIAKSIVDNLEYYAG